MCVPMKSMCLLFVLGSFVYLDVTNKVRGSRAILQSPWLEAAYSNCVFDFFYVLHGEDPGGVKIRLVGNHTDPTVLFDENGKN